MLLLLFSKPFGYYFASLEPLLVSLFPSTVAVVFVSSRVSAIRRPVRVVL